MLSTQNSDNLDISDLHPSPIIEFLLLPRHLHSSAAVLKVFIFGYTWIIINLAYQIRPDIPESDIPEAERRLEHQMKALIP